MEVRVPHELDYAQRPTRYWRLIALLVLAVGIVVVGILLVARMRTQPGSTYLTGLRLLEDSRTQPDQPVLQRPQKHVLLSDTPPGEASVAYSGPLNDPNRWIFIEVKSAHRIYHEGTDAEYSGTMLWLGGKVFIIATGDQPSVRTEAQMGLEAGSFGRGQGMPGGPWIPRTGRLVGGVVVIPFYCGDDRIEIVVDADGNVADASAATKAK